MDMRFGIDFAKTQLISLLKHLKKKLLQFREQLGVWRSW